MGSPSRAWLARQLPVPCVILLVALGAAACGGGDESATPPVEPPTTVPETPPPPTETTPPADPSTPVPPPTETAPQPAPTSPTPLPPPSVPFSWSSAGAFVWHETDVEPTLLGTALRNAGFGWVAVYLHDGMAEDPVEADWAYRVRLASGLPVGGWGVLRTQPEDEARLAQQLLARYHLDFYVANPEVEYEFSGPNGPDSERSGRSRRFVDAFRALMPNVPAGVSSYCRPDLHDIDWPSWRQAGFAFLPQAYANDLGQQGLPASCVAGAASFFSRETVHPTVGMHPGTVDSLDAAAYVELLDQAGTVGFSVYLAETRMTDAEWQVFGSGIAERGIARAA